jgi:hypothetical protein
MNAEKARELLNHYPELVHDSFKYRAEGYLDALERGPEVRALEAALKWISGPLGHGNGLCCEEVAKNALANFKKATGESK